MKVKVCPVCNSKDISPFTLFKFEQRSGLVRDKCNNCGYVGLMEVMEMKESNKLKVLKPEKDDN